MRKRLSGLFVVLLVAELIAGSHVNASSAENDEYLWVFANDDDAAIVYDGMWLQQRNDNAYGESEAIAFRPTAGAEFFFDGSAVKWIGSTGMGRGTADVYVNDELAVAGVDLYDPHTNHNETIFEIEDLKPGPNRLRIVPTGEHSPDAYMAHVAIEAFAFIPSLEHSIRTAQALIDEAGAPAVGERLLPYYTADGIADLIDTVQLAKAQQEAALEDTELNRNLLIDLRKHGEEIATMKPVFTDRSDAENDGIVGGGPLWTQDEQGSLLEFDDSTSQYVRSLHTGMLDGAGDVEMEIELYLGSDFWNSQHGVIAGIHNGSGSTSNQQFTFTRHSNNTMQFRLNTTGRHEVNTVMSPGEYDEQWITLKAVFDDGHVSVFVNDVQTIDYEANAPVLLELDEPFFLSTESANYDVGSRGFIGKVRSAKVTVDGTHVLDWTFDDLEQPN